ncbi:class I SAM-dependent methyltransferase [Nocardioides marmorisolisilvae]|uniref:class I SAM-dependent methyltransferase n=1 Tax=Nocardioides marmorisolisilvae TaxID=1542737 RepID=UPI001C83D966|nr:class I SAM-dependent methyltransferase [Nocardioides marmorisolisilvae]
MSEHEDRHSAEYWDERYSAEPVWSGNPNAALVAEASDLGPGRALDVGCGEGADSVWLALGGWDVTALDISAKAVERTAAVADQAGVAVVGVAAGILEAELASGSFDLVSVMYPAILRTPTRDAERRLLDLVAPGGTLLVVHHADVDREHALNRGFDPDDYVSPEDVRIAAVEQGGWSVVVDERRDRSVEHGAGAHHKADLVVRLRRG